MVSKYHVKADDIIKFMQKYNGSLPTQPLAGTYDCNDLQYAIRDNFDMTKFSYNRLIVQMKQEDVIHIQKYKRSGYGEYSLHWLNHIKLLENYGISAQIRENTDITNKIASTSLAINLMNFADSMQSKDKHLWRTACNTIYNKPVNDLNDRHFTINSKGVMTYTPKGRMTATTEDREKWLADNKYRSEIKFGKGLRKIFQHQSIKVPNNVIEFFANKLKGMYTFTGKIDVVSGSSIREWYNGENYATYNTESLGNSCMRHRSCRNFFDVYTENEDKVQMIIALDDENKLIGRAILWNTDSHGLFCDRIYGTQMTIEAIKSYAKKLGAYTKAEQSYHNATLISTTGEAIQETIKITLNKGGFDSYPYMDTLKYSNDISNKNELILVSDYGDYNLECTDGGPDGNYVSLHNGDRVHINEARWINRFNSYYLDEDTVYSEHHGEDIVYSESISVFNGTDYAWEDCEDFRYVGEEGEYYYYDEVVWSNYQREYLHEFQECVIHGAISVSNTQIIVVNENEYTCHNDVTIEDLLSKNIITLAEYENAVNNEIN